LVAGLIVFVLLWFQPQKLLIEKKVDEPVPSAGSARSVVDEIAVGSFRSLEHRTSGRARLIRLTDGLVVLRLEGLDTSNGPDLRVYLSKLPADRGWHDYGVEYVDLGGLKGNRGDANYRVPATLDLGAFRSAVIWCRRFKVGFGVAPLKR